MNYNPQITSKLNELFHSFQLKPPKGVVFKNILNSETFVLNMYNKYKNHDSEKLVLLKNKQKLKKSEEKDFSDQYKLENFMLKKLGKKNYDLFHETFPLLTFQDFLSLKLELTGLDKDLETSILENLQAYKEKSKIVKTTFSFYYASNQMDSISILNEIANKYPLKKENFKYSIDLKNHVLEVVRQEVTKILEKSKGNTHYKI